MKKTVIYGFGGYGVELFFRLRYYGINIDCFADRFEKKQGYAIRGCQCISYEELLRLNKNTLIIIALESPQKVKESLIEIGFCNVIGREEVTNYYNIGEVSVESIKTLEEAKNLRNKLNRFLDGQEEDESNTEMGRMVEDYQCRMKERA